MVCNEILNKGRYKTDSEALIPNNFIHGLIVVYWKEGYPILSLGEHTIDGLWAEHLTTGQISKFAFYDKLSFA